MGSRDTAAGPESRLRTAPPIMHYAEVSRLEKQKNARVRQSAPARSARDAGSAATILHASR